MPISRDARMDRRRRLLRENVDEGLRNSSSNRRKNGTADPTEGQTDAAGPKRQAGYSQDVRKACGQRLVQLIPVRRRSFAAVVVISLLVPALLLLAHYMIYVSGQLPWYGHPLAVAFDASHPRGIAAWLSSHLWLLCLATTVLTFQLRRHKLDDYNGEYRLWFWLVLTCLLASMDATTNIIDLFGVALDPWSQIHIGWSGPAVVDSTLAVLIGMLGLRLCTELKSVPLSLSFWLLGLTAWAGSAALVREELKIDLSVQFRIWLTSTLWLAGLTSIWLSALTYLRHTYVEAQRRFLLRGRLTNTGVSIRQRLRESLPNMPVLPTFRRAASATDETSEQPPKKSRWGLPAKAALAKRDAKSQPQEPSVDQRRSTPNQRDPQTSRPAADSDSARVSPGAASAESVRTASLETKPRGLSGFLRRTAKQTGEDTSHRENRTVSQAAKQPVWSKWLPKPKNDDDAEEFRKVLPTAAAAPSRPSQPSHDSQPSGAKTPSKESGWLPKLSRPKLPTMAKPNSPAGAKPKSKSDRSKWLKLPRIKLPSLRLPPPDQFEDVKESHPRERRSVQANERPLPEANSSVPADSGRNEFDDDSPALTKAERKRIRRLQQQNNRAA